MDGLEDEPCRGKQWKGNATITTLGWDSDGKRSLSCGVSMSVRSFGGERGRGSSEHGG